MDSGIYKLSFTGTDQVYIGRSKHLNLRSTQHKSTLKVGSASKKLQAAYNKYGMPSFSIVEYAEEFLLETLEKEYIIKYNSVDNGFNTRKSTSGGHSGLFGETNGRSKYSNDQIIDCLFLLIGDSKITYPIIAQRTGVPKSTIVDIVSGNNHKWLETVFPNEYSLLLSFKNKTNTRFYLKAVSPDGIIYTVGNLSQFCAEHRLSTGNMSRLLRGKCKSYGNWTAIAQ